MYSQFMMHGQKNIKVKTLFTLFVWHWDKLTFIYKLIT